MHKLTTYLKVISHSRDHQRLFVTANENMRFQKILARKLPAQLTKRCCIGSCSNGALVIKASNSAVAAKLKQMVPSLLKEFENQINSIRIAVDTQDYKNQGNDETKISKKPAISSAGLQTLQQLEITLAQSPLKSAIHSLLSQYQLNDSAENH